MVGAGRQRAGQMIETLSIRVHGQGLYPITERVAPLLAKAPAEDGLCTVFIRHTSASLLIQENCDPDVCSDLQNWLNRLVPENDPLYTHTQEGPDDMPAHIKGALTATHLAVPFSRRRLLLGTWQGIFLWEHRHHGSAREIVIHLGA
jgi:secondary thiamine-phosphate synthase enzyme